MAYSTANPPDLVIQTMRGNKIWHYSSADVIGTVTGSGYFTNGEDLGMAVGDAIYVLVTGSGALYHYRVSAVSAGAATIAAMSTA
jgi:hypothetical protein